LVGGEISKNSLTNVSNISLITDNTVENQNFGKLKNTNQKVTGQPKSFNQTMGDLPKQRLEPARPFVKTGIDNIL
jgi:hypothetical protein